MSELIQAGDQVLVTLEDGKTFLLRLAPGKRHSMHKGALDHDDLIGREWGEVANTNTGAPVYLLRPRWIDRMMKVHRRTNIMYPKDVTYLIASLDIGPGSRVAELGSGSGAMTQALARAVSPGGAVFTYDRRPEFSELARSNCENAGIVEGVEYRIREAGDEIEPDVDAVLTDVPEPWVELPMIHRALRGSGRFAAGLPTFNQAENLAVGLENHGFAMIETLEIMVREILARAGRTRPAHRMIGHTMLLTTAVKVVTRPAPEADTPEDEADEDEAGSEASVQAHPAANGESAAPTQPELTGQASEVEPGEDS
jgi:tRNA (adenine57-N1/adenine58-N1)-methyltransferase